MTEADGMKWFRAHHGAPFDPKIAVVAKRSGQPRAMVVAVWWVFLDIASQSKNRGYIDNVDFEEVAVSMDMETDAVEAIFNAMRAKEMIDEDLKISNWEKRQPKRDREETSTPRVRRYREKQRNATETHETPCNATETHVTPRNATVTPLEREEEGEKEVRDVSFANAQDTAPVAPNVSDKAKGKTDPQPEPPAKPKAEPEDPDVALYRRGKEVLGKKSGGVITKLKAAKGSIPAARAVIEAASIKENPIEYVQGAIRNTNGSGEESWRTSPKPPPGEHDFELEEWREFKTWKSRVRMWQRDGIWLGDWGEEPDHPRTNAPKEILEEFGVTVSEMKRKYPDRLERELREKESQNA